MAKIAVVGTGYVGLVTGTCFGELGNDVICVRRNKKIINNLKRGIIPIYEPGLEELVKKNLSAKRLHFTTEVAGAVKKSEIIFIAVGTPSLPDGTVDLSQVREAADSIGRAMNGYKVIVNKSTVPIGTGDLVARIIKKHYKGDFDVVSNPEFLREGTAVDDFMHPDRVIIGDGGAKPRKIMKTLYRPLRAEIVFTDVKTAEMIKYASNALLATEISFINSIANICERLGADVKAVSHGVRLDRRIGRHAFLDAGVGYGGSCFPKDVKGLIQIAHEAGLRFDILESVEDTNEAQKESLLPKIQKLVGDDLAGKKIAIWGLAFKAHTDDMRDAPSLVIIKQLQDRDAKITAFDPVAKKQAKEMVPDITYAADPFTAATGADCLVIVTAWPEFRELDLKKLKKTLKSPNIVDGRNIWEPKSMKELGFNYLSVGR